MHRTIAWLAAFLSLSAGVASAHPGHGVTDPEGPAHYFIEPLHALPVLFVALAIGVVWRASRVQRRATARRERDSDE